MVVAIEDILAFQEDRSVPHSGLAGQRGYEIIAYAGIRGGFCCYAGDLKSVGAVISQRFSDRVGIPEIFPGGFFCNDNGERPGEHPARVSCFQAKGKEPEEVAVGKDEIFLTEFLFRIGRVYYRALLKERMYP
jgi:hypothetical protein